MLAALTLIWLGSVVALAVGLISPRLALSLFFKKETHWTRRRAVSVYGSIALFTTVVAGFLAAPVSNATRDSATYVHTATDSDGVAEASESVPSQKFPAKLRDINLGSEPKTGAKNKDGEGAIGRSSSIETVEKRPGGSIDWGDHMAAVEYSIKKVICELYTCGGFHQKLISEGEVKGHPARVYEFKYLRAFQSEVEKTPLCSLALIVHDKDFNQLGKVRISYVERLDCRGSDMLAGSGGSVTFNETLRREEYTGPEISGGTSRKSKASKVDRLQGADHEAWVQRYLACQREKGSVGLVASSTRCVLDLHKQCHPAYSEDGCTRAAFDALIRRDQMKAAGEW